MLTTAPLHLLAVAVAFVCACGALALFGCTLASHDDDPAAALVDGINSVTCTADVAALPAAGGTVALTVAVVHKNVVAADIGCAIAPVATSSGAALCAPVSEPAAQDDDNVRTFTATAAVGKNEESTAKQLTFKATVYYGGFVYYDCVDILLKAAE